MNKETRIALRIVIEIISVIILFIIYRVVIMKGPIFYIPTLGLDIAIGAVIAGLVNGIVDEIPALDPDKELYEKLSKGPHALFQETREKYKNNNEDTNK